MKVFYDSRKTKDPLKYQSTRTRNFVGLLSDKISQSLATGTSSNYNSNQFGPNHKIIYDGVAHLFAQIILDISDLDDDGNFNEMRVEFLTTKITSLIFDEENTPTSKDDLTLRQIITNTAHALIEGSEEKVILDLLTETSNGSKIEIKQVDNHLIKVLTSVLGYTQTTNAHRHFVFAPDKGIGSTLSPIGYSWGDDLHQHEIIDGVVQPYKDKDGNSHTHAIDLSLPQEIVNLQNNIRKLLRTTKPAHIKLGEISSVLGETISPPTLQTVNFKRNNPDDPTPAYDTSTSTGLCFTYSSSFQENLRRARNGTYENIVYGYSVGKSIRVFRSLVEKSDRILSRSTSYAGVIAQENGEDVSPLLRRVVNLTEIVPEDGNYAWEVPRFSTSGTGSISSGYFINDAGNLSLSYLGEGELVLLDNSAYFVEIRSSFTFYLRALEIETDNIATTNGFQEITFYDYPWKSPALKYRETKVVVSNDGGDTKTSLVLNIPVRKTYRGMPLLKSDLISVESHTIENYEPLTNKLTLSTLIANNTELTFRVPYGEGDSFSFTELNNSSFVLNKPRARGTAEILSNRGHHLDRNLKGLDVGNLPSVGLFPALPVQPKTKEIFTLKTSTKRTHGLNNENLGLGSLVLNQSDLLHKVSRERVTDIARGVAEVSKGSVPLYAFGFLPDHIISITNLSTSLEVSDFKVVEGVLFIDVSDGTMVRLEAISSTPLKSGESWNKGGESLSEGQVPFLDPVLVNFDPTSDSISPPSVEELMNRPQGRRLRGSTDNSKDSPRTLIQKKEETLKGITGEEIFFEDDALELKISGSPFNSPMNVLRDKGKLYAPSLKLNSATSLIGDSTRLNQDPNVVTEHISKLLFST